MEEHPEARRIIDTLRQNGFIAYYAGGWVRDFLLNHPSDDIDIATDAPPEKVQSLFEKTVPIGLAFGIILVILDGRQYEVATFRQDIDYQDGRRPTQIQFTSAEEDAKRRDFTINGMFYDPIRQEIIDYVEGQADLDKKLIRAIGDPHQRIKEDRLRMIRGIRLACRFGFKIDPATQDAIRSHAAELLPAVAIERIVQELCKGLAFGSLGKMLVMLHEFSLLAPIFPSLAATDVEEIEKRLEPLHRYPKTAPLIACLLPLFPDWNLEEQLDLCKRLKLSNIDAQFVSFLYHAKKLIEADLNRSRTIELVEWAYFYAHRFSTQVLQIISAHLPALRHSSFLHHHEEQIERLCESIARIHRHHPVVSSEHLKKEGIRPGKTMGVLLKEAERISCNQQLFDPLKIIAQLQTSPLWPSDPNQA